MAGLEAVYDAVWAAGQSEGIANFGSYTLNALRLEKGFKGASELTNEVTLPEADVMAFCRLEKDDFIGKAATEESKAGTLPWVCVYLEVDAADADPHSSETVYMKGQRVGQISSGAYGQYVEKALAFAYVKPEAAAPGTELEVMVLGREAPGKGPGRAGL